MTAVALMDAIEAIPLAIAADENVAVAVTVSISQAGARASVIARISTPRRTGRRLVGWWRLVLVLLDLRQRKRAQRQRQDDGQPAARSGALRRQCHRSSRPSKLSKTPPPLTLVADCRRGQGRASLSASAHSGPQAALAMLLEASRIERDEHPLQR